MQKTKPLINLADVEFDDIENNGLYTSRRATISDLIGARKLGYNLTELRFTTITAQTRSLATRVFVERSRASPQNR
jgi:hypothetical protein